MTEVKEVQRFRLAVTNYFGKTGIAKEGANKFQKYRYRGIEQVLPVLNQLCVEHQVYFKTDSKVVATDIVGEDYVVIFLYTYTFTSTIDNSSTSDTFVVPIKGTDISKYAGLASSYGLKEWAFKTFFIPTEGMEDPDTGLHLGLPDPDTKKSSTTTTAKKTTKAPATQSSDTEEKRKKRIGAIGRLMKQKGLDMRQEASKVTEIIESVVGKGLKAVDASPEQFTEILNKVGEYCDAK